MPWRQLYGVITPADSPAGGGGRRRCSVWSRFARLRLALVNGLRPTLTTVSRRLAEGPRHGLFDALPSNWARRIVAVETAPTFSSGQVRSRQTEDHKGAVETCVHHAPPRDRATELLPGARASPSSLMPPRPSEQCACGRPPEGEGSTRSSSCRSTGNRTIVHWSSRLTLRTLLRRRVPATCSASALLNTIRRVGHPDRPTM